MKTLEQRIRDLPNQLQYEVEDFVDFLSQKKIRKSGKKLRQDWAGALHDFAGQFTSLKLQKKALEWRGD